MVRKFEESLEVCLQPEVETQLSTKKSPEKLEKCIDYSKSKALSPPTLGAKKIVPVWLFFQKGCGLTPIRGIIPKAVTSIRGKRDLVYCYVPAQAYLHHVVTDYKCEITK